MIKSFFRDRKLLILILLAVLIKLFSLNADWVERYYTYGFYPIYSRILRTVFGWVPFSVGDLLYTAAFIFLVVKAWKLIRLLAKRKVKEYLSWILFRKYLRLVFWIYIIFNLSWGLNYDRKGIASQLGLDVQRYSKEDLFQLTKNLQVYLNYYAARIDTNGRSILDQNKELFRQGINDYKEVKKDFPFLAYPSPSIKPSIFSSVGHYFGFSGYFNPFTHEAQLNTSDMVFTRPFVCNHEIAHQLGYGKENEASFVSYLASKNSYNPHFRYSVYYELFFTAMHEVRITRDTAFINSITRTLHQRIKTDRLNEIAFKLRRKNVMSPYVSDFYNNYLKLNNQPKGLATYNEVIAWMVAYLKRYGEL